MVIDGGDECDKMAKVFKCGNDKDPELVTNMMQVAAVATPMVDFSSFQFMEVNKLGHHKTFSPRHDPKGTCPQFPCPVDVTEL
jgi:hypothetical protein